MCNLLLEKLSDAEAEVVQLVQDTGQSSGRDTQGHRSTASLRCAGVHASFVVHSFGQSGSCHLYTAFYIHILTREWVYTHVYVLTHDASCIYSPC